MSQTSPLTLFIQTPWNALQKGLLPRRGQWAITYGWLTFFPNQQTFGLEITGQTNEFNELSRRQWMPLAIWTPIKGYGQVSRPFQGVCTQMWQNAVASVSTLTSCSKCLGCHGIVPSRQHQHPHFCCSLCVWCPFNEESDKHKSRRMQSFFSLFSRVCYHCLISLCSRTWRRYAATSGRDVIVAINKAEVQRRTTSDSTALLLPPFHRFGFLILPFHFPAALIVTFTSWTFPFHSSDVSSGFPPPANWKRKWGIVANFFSLFLPIFFGGYFRAAANPNCGVNDWERNSSKHMVFVCSLNWINWRSMGNHRGG